MESTVTSEGEEMVAAGRGVRLFLHVSRPPADPGLIRSPQPNSFSSPPGLPPSYPPAYPPSRTAARPHPARPHPARRGAWRQSKLNVLSGFFIVPPVHHRHHGRGRPLVGHTRHGSIDYTAEPTLPPPPIPPIPFPHHRLAPPLPASAEFHQSATVTTITSGHDRARGRADGWAGGRASERVHLRGKPGGTAQARAQG